MKFFFVYGKKTVIMAAVVLIAVIALAINFPAAKNLVASAVVKKELPIYCVDTDKKEVALKMCIRDRLISFLMISNISI